MRHETWKEVRVHFLGFLTWFLKLFIEQRPCLCDPLQALLHGLDVHVGAVALWELGVTMAPAVVVLADKFSLSITGYVAESSLHEAFSQVVWKDHLQACKTEPGYRTVNLKMTVWWWLKLLKGQLKDFINLTKFLSHSDEWRQNFLSKTWLWCSLP